MNSKQALIDSLETGLNFLKDSGNSINELAERHYANLKKLGYLPEGRRLKVYEIVVQLALIDTEVSEAIEELRARYCLDETPELNYTFTLHTELADICLRVFGLASAIGVNIGAEIEEKMEINAAPPTSKPRKMF